MFFTLVHGEIPATERSANTRILLEMRDLRPQLAATAVALSMAALPPDAADARWRVLRQLLRGSDFAAAEQVVRVLAKERPGDLRAAFYLGLVLHKEKRHAEALGHLERAAGAPAGEFPEAPHVVHYLGWCRYYLGDLDGARAAFTAHANAFPNYDDSHFGLGLVAFDEDRLPEAEASFRRALELLNGQQGTPRDRAKNLARLGDVLLRQDRLAEAEQCYRRSVETLETNGEAWSKLARVLERLGRPADAADARARQEAIKARGSAGNEP